MELLKFIEQIPVPILVVVLALLVALTVVMTVKYVKSKGLDGLRAEVYQLILKAEHMFKGSEKGKQKLAWVVQQARSLLPKWLQFFITDKALEKLIQIWFNGVKDLLDDGKFNNSLEK